MPSSRTLQIRLHAINLTKKAFTGVRAGLMRIRVAAASAMATLGKATRAARGQIVLLFAVLGGWQALIKGPAEFNRQLQLTGTLGEEARAHLGEFRTEVQRIAVGTGVALDQLNKGLFDTISAGTKAADAIGVLRESARLAVAGGADLAAVVRGLATVTNAYGISGRESFRMVAEEMFAAQVLGKTTIEALSDNVGKLAAVSAEAGISIRHMFTALADTANIMNNTEEAAVSLRQSIVAILKPNEKLARIMKAAGIPMGVAAFQWGNLGEIFSAVKSKAKEMHIPLVQAIGNIRAIGATSVLAQRGGDRFNEMLERQAKLAGELSISYDNMQKTLAQTMERMGNFIKIIGQGFSAGLLLGFNERLMEILENFEELAIRAEIAGIQTRRWIEGIMPAVHLITATFHAFIATIEIVTLSVVAGIVNALALLKVTLFDIGTVLFEMLTGLVKAVTQTALHLVTAVLEVIDDLVRKAKVEIQALISDINFALGTFGFDPIPNIADSRYGIPGLQEAVAGMKNFNNDMGEGFDTFKAMLTRLREDTTLQDFGMEVTGTSMDIITERLNKVSASVDAVIESFTSADWKIGAKRVKELQKALADLASGVTDARKSEQRRLDDALRKIIDGPTEDDGKWTDFWEEFGIGVDTAIKALEILDEDIQKLGANTIKHFETSVASMFHGFITGTKTAKEAFAGFLNSIAQEISRLMAKRAVAQFFAMFTGAFGGSSSGGTGGGGGHISTTPQPDQFLAHGGIVRRPTSALIGEAGPEAVVPLPNGRSIPVDFKGGGGGGAVTINISAVDGPSVQRMLMSDDGRQAIQAAIRDARSTRRDFR